MNQVLCQILVDLGCALHYGMPVVDVGIRYIVVRLNRGVRADQVRTFCADHDLEWTRTTTEFTIIIPLS